MKMEARWLIKLTENKLIPGKLTGWSGVVTCLVIAKEFREYLC